MICMIRNETLDQSHMFVGIVGSQLKIYCLALLDAVHQCFQGIVRLVSL